MSRNSRRRRRKDKSDIGIFEIVNGLLTSLLTGLGILVSWTMLKYNFLNFKGINYAILVYLRYRPSWARPTLCHRLDEAPARIRLGAQPSVRGRA